MGLGSYVPPEISRWIVPRVPRRWQRFTSATTWAEAEAESMGYVQVPVGGQPVTTPVPPPLEGNQIAIAAAFGVALGAHRVLNEPVRVVDFGGHDGKHADLIESIFPGVSFDWIVVDLPPVVDAMASRRRPGLTFEWDLSRALESKTDIVLASASLNYVPAPMNVLDAMCVSASFVVLARLPLWPIKEHAAAVQRTQRRPQEISYPTWFFSERDFLAHLPKESRVLMDFVCPDDRAAFAGQYVAYRGLVIDSRLTTTLDDT